MDGNRFVDGSGNTVQLRGVNISYLESVAIEGWDTGDPWGGATPHWSALAAWKVNVVRIPLNEASWLGYSCVSQQQSGNPTINPDPGGNYQQTVKQTVADATAAGFYVILDLHWSAPGNQCPEWQNAMADADHSVTFWSQIATTFGYQAATDSSAAKGNPAVIFELYNEPWVSSWDIWLNGGAYTQAFSPTSYSIVTSSTWQVAGMQQLLDTVRATGATNVVLAGGNSLSNDLTGWTTHMPKDPLGQLGAAWHIYHTNPYIDMTAGSATIQMVQAVHAVVPVAITETGDVNECPASEVTAGACSANTGATPSFAPPIIRFAEQEGLSYLGWTWNVWPQTENILIQDLDGTPSGGWGVYFQQHLLCRASGGTSCN